MWIWSVGMQILYFPTYAPLYNPMDSFLKLVKSNIRDLYSDPGTEELVLLEALTILHDFSLEHIFDLCGYSFTRFAARFDPFKHHTIENMMPKVRKIEE
jgi:hypothetical protein